MNVLIVVESCFGNTSRVADAVAEGLRSVGATVTVVGAASHPAIDDADLLLAGAPTHNMGLPSASTRRQARAKGGAVVESGVAEWLGTLSGRSGPRTAVFDTVTGTGVFTGSAAKKMEKRLRRLGLDVVARESFLVGGVEGPLAEGELVRAEQWGTSLR